MAVNKVILLGRLGQDPEVKFTQGGQAVATLSVATSESWVNKEGKKEEKTEWHRVVVWGKQAESVGKYLKKGREVYVEGKLCTRSWEDQSGQKRYTTEIVANPFGIHFIGSRQESESSSYHAPHPAEAAPSYTPSYGADSDDVPF